VFDVVDSKSARRQAMTESLSVVERRCTSRAVTVSLIVLLHAMLHLDAIVDWLTVQDEALNA